jgi:hypothetical protein
VLGYWIPGGDSEKHKEFSKPPPPIPPNKLDDDKKLLAKWFNT